MPSRRILRGVRDQGCTLGILAVVIVLVALPLLPMFMFTGLGNWLYPCFFLSFGLMASTPLFLQRVAPRAAGFDTQWFPNGWRQWLGTLALIVLMFAVGSLAKKLTVYLNLGSYRPYYVPTITSFSRLTVVLNGLIWILVGPFAEEIFYRGYVLDQLRKLAHWSIATFGPRCLLRSCSRCGLEFIPCADRGLLVCALACAWRIRFKALLPLIVSHMVINAAAMAPVLSRDYENVVLLERVAPDLQDKVRSNPICQQIVALTRQPAAKALPALIRFLGEGDEAILISATWAITQYRRDEVRPYLKEALASGDKRLVSGALLVIELKHDASLREEVRQVVWSGRDPDVQMPAIMTLYGLGDTEGIRRIAERSPNRKLRDFAERMLRYRK